MSISLQMANFVYCASLHDIPQDVLEQSKFAFADYIAVTYVGSFTDDATIICKYCNNENSSGNCSIIGIDRQYSDEHAVTINAMMAHALDYDDVGLTAINHPSITNAPVAFACAEELHLNGANVLLAYALGIECQHKIAQMLMPDLTDRGWHTTSVFGTIGAAITASKSLGLDAKQTANAIGIAASMASGLRVNFGSYTKPFHAGMACRNGLTAAKLARCGMTATDSAIEGADGFASAFAGKAITEADLHLGMPWDAQEFGYQFKKYPVCSSSHTAIDAFLSLQERYGFTAAEIEEVTAGVSAFAFRNLLYDRPEDTRQAKFSMPYAIACCALKGGCTLDHFTEDAVHDEEIRRFMPKVSMVLADEFAADGILNNEPAIVTVRLKDNRTLTQRVDYALGTIKNPISKSRLQAKFDNCLKTVNDNVRRKVFDTVFRLEELHDINELTEQWKSMSHRE